LNNWEKRSPLGVGIVKIPDENNDKMIKQSTDGGPQRSCKCQANTSDTAQNTNNWEEKEQQRTAYNALETVIPRSIDLTREALAHKTGIRLSFKLSPGFGNVTPERSQTRV
jgi:hypothetical protein